MTVVLRPGCPLCGQTIRSNDWIDTVGIQPIAVAHEIEFGRRTISRRALNLGEKSSSEAVYMCGYNHKKKPMFAPAGGLEAPPGWMAKITHAMQRAANALAIKFENSYSSHDEDIDYTTYVEEARQAVKHAQEELELRIAEARNAEK